MIFSDDTDIPESISSETKVYPNPAIDLLYFDNATSLHHIQINSISGQLVYQSEETKNSIDVKDFPAGMYKLHANGIDGTRYQAKFIV